MFRSIFAVSAAFVLCAPAHTQDCLRLKLVGPAVDLSTGATTQRRGQSVAYNSVDDEYMSIWFDTSNPGNNDIFGQRVAANGGLLGENFPVMEFAAAQIDPFIVYNSADNQYLAAWRTQQGGFFNKARGRILAADGSFTGDDFFIGNGMEVAMVYNPAANEYLQTGRSPGIRGQRISSAGGRQGGAIVITDAGAPAPNGRVAYDGDNNRYLTTWRDQVDRNLKGRVINANGSPFGPPFLISGQFPGSSRAAGVAYDPDKGRYLVVFGLFQDVDILGQFVSADGTLDGDSFFIAEDLPSQTNAFVAYAGAARAYVVTWREGLAITAKVVSGEGVVSDETLTVSSGAVAGNPDLAYNSTNGEFLFTWPDNRNINEGEQDIFAQRVAFSCCDPCDTNCDGSVDLTDVEPFIGLLLGEEPCAECSGDTNGDGSIDLTDVEGFIACLLG